MFLGSTCLIRKPYQKLKKKTNIFSHLPKHVMLSFKTSDYISIFQKFLKLNIHSIKRFGNFISLTFCTKYRWYIQVSMYILNVFLMYILKFVKIKYFKDNYLLVVACVFSLLISTILEKNMKTLLKISFLFLNQNSNILYNK